MPAPIGRVVHIVVVKPVKFVGGQVREKWGRAYVWVGDIMPQLSLHNALISVSINNIIPSHYKCMSCDLHIQLTIWYIVRYCPRFAWHI